MSETKELTEITVPANHTVRAEATYREYNELDLGELICVYVRKWLKLGLISAAVAILAYLFISFVYNKSNTRYEANFNFSFPGSENSCYPDGTTFSFQDFASESYIRKAVESNPDFAKLDVENMVDNHAVKVAQASRELKDGTIEYLENYTISVNARYFENRKQAEAFAHALIVAGVERIETSSATVYYKRYLDSFDKADTFEDKLESLKLQEEYLQETYESWIKDYGEQYPIGDNKLSYYAESANLSFTEKAYNALFYELKQRRYSLDGSDEEKNNCLIQIEVLQAEYEDNDKKLQGLINVLETLNKDEIITTTDIVNGTTSESSYYEKIAEYIERQVDIEREIEGLEKQIENIKMTSEANAFAEKLESVKGRLLEATSVLEQKVAPTVYSEKSEAVWDSKGMVSDGGMSAVLIAGVVFVLMYIVVGFFEFVLQNDKKKNA